MIYLETYLDDDRLPVIEKTKICEEKVTLNNPELIFNFLNKYLRLGKRTEEYVYLICFDTKSHPLGLFEISHGTVNSAVLSPREIYMKALLCGAANICWQQAFGKRNMLLEYLQKDYLWILWKGK